MRIAIKALGAAGLLLATAACGGGADDQAAANIEATAENQSEMLESQAENAEAMGNEQAADMLEEKADNIEEMGEQSAEQVDDDDGPTVANGTTNGM